MQEISEISEISEDEYAMKFCMLIILDEQNTSGMDKYTDNFKNILESYKKILKNHPRMVIYAESPAEGSGEYKEMVHTLRELCRVGNINLILRQRNLSQSALFAILVEAIHRTMILVRYYAPDGDLLSDILEETYCSRKDLSEVQLCRNLYVSRATLYRRRRRGIMYAGYFFFEAVLPQMEGII